MLFISQFHYIYSSSSYHPEDMATESIPLKLMVDKSRNRVVFAESGKDFIDVLFSFLTLPMATIILLSNKQPSIVCLENLYSSVEPLYAQGLLTASSREQEPAQGGVLVGGGETGWIDEYVRNLQRLIINIDDTRPECRYICDSEYCDSKLLTHVQGTSCACGKMKTKEVHLKATSYVHGTDADVFVRGRGKFLISDDGVIAPASTEGIMSFIQNLQIEDKNCLEEREVYVDHTNVLLLLSHYSHSKTPFTDVFLGEQCGIQNLLQPAPKFGTQQPQTGKVPLKSKSICIKLAVYRQEEVLYAEAKRDFVDLLFSFLTFPAGSVLKLLGGASSIRCIDHLYKAAQDLSLFKLLKDKQTEDLLLNPKLPPKFSLWNQLIQVDEQLTAERYYMCRDCDSVEVSLNSNDRCQCQAKTYKRLDLADPKLETDGGFLKSAVYMVTDDLVVRQFSSVSVIRDHLNRVEEDLVRTVVVDIGETEALALLQASLTSSQAFTDAFASRLGLSPSRSLTDAFARRPGLKALLME